MVMGRTEIRLMRRIAQTTPAETAPEVKYHCGHGKTAVMSLTKRTNLKYHNLIQECGEKRC